MLLGAHQGRPAACACSKASMNIDVVKKASVLAEVIEACSSASQTRSIVSADSSVEGRKESSVAMMGAESVLLLLWWLELSLSHLLASVADCSLVAAGLLLLQNAQLEAWRACCSAAHGAGGGV